MRNDAAGGEDEEEDIFEATLPSQQALQTEKDKA
jgi:hypothetical protein